jgi:hypothetical protein
MTADKIIRNKSRECSRTTRRMNLGIHEKRRRMEKGEVRGTWHNQNPE